MIDRPSPAPSPDRVRIVPRLTTSHVVTDVLFVHEGRHYGSRLAGAIADTPDNRAFEWAAFLRRREKDAPKEPTNES